MEEVDVSADQMGRTVQFLAKTYISWQIWKETEPELFERTFKVWKCDIKFTGDEHSYLIELEMPLDQIGRLDSGIKDGSLAVEIDKIHGLDPVLHRGKKDVKISKFQVSLAPAQPANIETRKTIEALEKRLLKVEINERSRSIDLSIVMRDFLGYSVMMMKKFEELDKKVDEGLVSLAAKCDKMEKTVLKYK
ncbi:hypothetical protein HDV04_002310 [Boothiomyces sp. JEL0838]|nr:hypothetical protein HDV04_002503 [Boothiomyces sp. JEL0838]KAJ3313149.1 hypothetical protein HDV04_002310 [Boothiomyces sp. JEL0838]